MTLRGFDPDLVDSVVWDKAHKAWCVTSRQNNPDGTPRIRRGDPVTTITYLKG